VELLALNFHEHFEAKPLLVELDRELARGGSKAVDVPYARASLRSVARRVVDRQLAALIREARGDGSKTDRTRVEEVTVFDKAVTDDQRSLLQTLRGTGRAKVTEVGSAVDLESPDAKWKLMLFVTETDWANQTFKIEGSAQTLNQPEAIRIGFVLTWFDFPLTDNTLLADGNRFSIVLSSIDAEGVLKSARLKIVWFPKDYFTPRERPLDYRRFLELVGRRAS
jgi:hypothetical protein